ncbi:excisionase [Bradyrhizobium sp. HKCCYLS20291]|uniref:excisionase n=1 Tax=Bradyrhizobium sp. HKCCYLS20291 TaxID=3420766 RepID=UPI003EB6AE7A
MSVMPKIEGAGANLIDADTPMRLEDAVKYAFPLGGMTVAGLRKEIERGNLTVEKIANKHFTTLNNIKRMRERCRSKEKVPDSTDDLDQTVVTTYGSSETDQSSSAQGSLQDLVKRTRQRLRKSS